MDLRRRLPAVGIVVETVEPAIVVVGTVEPALLNVVVGVVEPATIGIKLHVDLNEFESKFKSENIHSYEIDNYSKRILD